MTPLTIKIPINVITGITTNRFYSLKKEKESLKADHDYSKIIESNISNTRDKHRELTLI